MKSSAVSVSIRRLPISGSNLLSWMRCCSRVESATSTRAARQLLAACSKVGEVGSCHVRSGTRFAREFTGDPAFALVGLALRLEAATVGPRRPTLVRDFGTILAIR